MVGLRLLPSQLHVRASTLALLQAHRLHMVRGTKVLAHRVVLGWTITAFLARLPQGPADVWGLLPTSDLTRGAGADCIMLSRCPTQVLAGGWGIGVRTDWSRRMHTRPLTRLEGL